MKGDKTVYAACLFKSMKMFNVTEMSSDSDFYSTLIILQCNSEPHDQTIAGKI